ncbi:uncharacterized protein [Physcomitrium patens]|uniref:J domain-containing protein n=1 Tax=Physcomitrium patens TaxID=3218 RepID=A0A2K1IZU8_PHYPA|nr:chaperone protein dnaJ 8, chloroplastic-like [Physcomitrium patens]PNR34790.1 hypothetical protein PHYPA_022688 [Physcomitrium patens]|eukprot:XP_024402131.1 chaperone protein dnaJ 8, chloroplastic-like [Physcomitrella patens]
MDLSALHSIYNPPGISSRETVVSRIWSRGVTSYLIRKNEGSRLMTRAYLPHSHATEDHHAVLGVSRFATKQEIKTSYRRLARELHPDVCKSEHCSTRFQKVKRAYEALIQESTSHFGNFENDASDNLEDFKGVEDSNWDEWEEWMGWEGAGTYDYSNHINPNM